MQGKEGKMGRFIIPFHIDIPIVLLVFPFQLQYILPLSILPYHLQILLLNLEFLNKRSYFFLFRCLLNRLLHHLRIHSFYTITHLDLPSLYILLHYLLGQCFFRSRERKLGGREY